LSGKGGAAENYSLTLGTKMFIPGFEDQLLGHKAGDEVDVKMYPNRLDLQDLAFCTIDPIDAKDFDDAIYFDEQKREIYVAIADVSEYVSEYSPIDKEAKFRGFSIYFPFSKNS